MRPLKLKMTAFGAYVKPVELDFEESLRGEKIFLIHGATGAGKTTILDAICFALYGTASGDERDGVMMRSKGISNNIKTEVEFEFALGEKIYNVRRTLSYNPNRKSNPNQLTAELKRDGQIIETQTRNVTNAITDLLGFNVKQFRQVVLLPQGEFKNFLSANSAERQPILDTLFNAALYNQIETELKRKADDAQSLFDDLNRDKDALTARFQNVEPDESTLAKFRADYFAAQKKSAELDKIFKEAQADYTAGKILASDFAELKRRNESLETAKKNLERAKKFFDDTKREYDQREGEQSEREKLKSDADKLAEIKKAFVDLNAKREALDKADEALKTANDAVKKCEEDAKKFEARLLQLKKRRSELSGAEKAFAEAQTVLDKAREREKILQEIKQLENDLKRARQRVSIAEKDFNAANVELERLQKLQRDGSAALLAKNLKDGEPCPVCGSRIHYPVDFSEKIIPSDSEIDAAQSKADERKEKLDKAKILAAQIQTAIDTKRDDLNNKKFADVPDKLTAQKIFDDAKKDADELADCDKRIELGEKYIADNTIKLNAANQSQNTALSTRSQRLGEWQTVQKQISEQYLENPAQLDADIAAAGKKFRELETAWKRADKSFREASDKKSSCEGALTTAQEAKDKLADKLKDKTPPDVDALKSRADEAQKNFNEAIREEMSLKKDLDELIDLSAQLSELNKKISAAEKTLRVWKRLSDAANGRISGNKLSFARYYLSAMFEQVLTEANYRLEKMSDRRYNLKSNPVGERADSKLGLNLEILDDYTGERRPVATLSGGESFLASLSLALGLAAVVRNNLGGIKLDTIFIDEGFGSLDSETLDGAISTIIEQSGGRLVGIISHVEELKNQMPVRLEVTKTKTGSHAEFKYGSSRD